MTEAVASPCIKVCQMDEATGWCAGCLRTLDEIAAWGGLDDIGRREVMQRLRGRRVAWRARQATLRTGAQTGAEPGAEPGTEPGAKTVAEAGPVAGPASGSAA